MTIQPPNAGPGSPAPAVPPRIAAGSSSAVTPTHGAVVQADGRGTTTIAEGVVAKVAAIATQGIPGVHALGGGAARALGSLREAVGQRDLTQGVNVEVGQTQVAVDVTLVVEYPHPLQKVAEDVRNAIYAAVEDLVGMEVTEVNVAITDIHIPSEDDGAEKSTAGETQPAPRGNRLS